MKRLATFTIWTLLLIASAYADQRFAITTTDGVEVMQVVQGTPEEAVAKWVPEHRAKVLSITPIDSTEIPTDRTFRDAWKFDRTAKKFSVDMPKARTMWKKKVLHARQLAAQDVDKQLSDADALGDAKGKDDAQLRRKTLDNIVPSAAIDAAKTPEELKATWPTNLPQPQE